MSKPPSYVSGRRAGFNVSNAIEIIDRATPQWVKDADRNDIPPQLSANYGKNNLEVEFVNGSTLLLESFFEGPPRPMDPRYTTVIGFKPSD